MSGTLSRLQLRSLPAKSEEEKLPVIHSKRLADRVGEAIRKCHAYYIEDQHKDGYWLYELESNVTITAEYLMLLHFLGLKDPSRDKKIAQHILKNQRIDGTWAIHW